MAIDAIDRRLIQIRVLASAGPVDQEERVAPTSSTGPATTAA